MTDRTQPDSASTTSSTHIIRYALEPGLLWVDGDGRDKVREALDALDTLEAQLEAIGAGGVEPLRKADHFRGATQMVPADHLRGATKMISHAWGCRANAFGQCDKGCTEAHEQLSRDALDAARYRWLRDGNGYAPEECGITGGEELDELCDEGVATQAKESGA